MRASVNTFICRLLHITNVQIYVRHTYVLYKYYASIYMCKYINSTNTLSVNIWFLNGLVYPNKIQTITINIDSTKKH